MILTPAEARLACGLTGTITDAERALLQMLLPKVDAAIIECLRYDPQYTVVSDGEWYPRSDGGGGASSGDGVWEVNATHAFLTSSNRNNVLQLQRIPVRSIQAIRVDWSGGFGQKPSTFGSSTQWTSGTDYWQDLIQPYFNATGHVFANAGWPTEPGTVLAKYTAGYTKLELRGAAYSSLTDPETTRSGSNVNASGIMAAAELTLLKAFKTIKAQAKQGRAGFVPGLMTSESLGSYSYSAGGGAESITGFKVVLSPEARGYLAPFIHYGIL